MRVAVYRLCQFVLRLSGRLLWGMRVEGAERMPPDGPVVVAVTHSSFLDPLLVGSALPRPLKFVARRTLFVRRDGSPRRLFGGAAGYLGAVPIDRDGGGGRAGLNTCKGWLERGWPVLIFPEGTRSTDGRVARFKRGVGVLALHGRYPVLPVSIEGTGEIWPKGRKLPRLFAARVRVRVGEPTVFERSMRPEEVAARVRDQILDLRGESCEEPGRDGAGTQEIAGSGSSA